MMHRKEKILSILVVLSMLCMVIPLFIESVEGELEYYNLKVYSSDSDGEIKNKDTPYATARTASTGTVDDTSQDIEIGQDATATFPVWTTIWRGFVFFDTSSIPEDAIVTQAHLNFTRYSNNSDVEFDIVVQNGISSTYPHDPLESGDYLYTRYAGDGGSCSSWDTICNIELNDDGKSWVNCGGQTKLCLRSQKDIGGTEPIWTDDERISIYANDSDEVFMPYLDITYYIPRSLDVELNTPTNGEDFGSEQLPVTLNLSATDSYGYNVTINFYGDGSLINTTFGNETYYEYDWTPTGGGIHTWNATVNCSEGYADGEWDIADNTSYCDYSTGSYSFMGITNVYMNDGELNKTSGYSNTPYENFTNYGCNLTLGQTYTVEVTLGGSYNQYLDIWVDWNNDSTLSADERYIGGNGIGTGTVITCDVEVPSYANTEGSCLMRVITDYNAHETDPCGTDNYGDCEDYSVYAIPNLVVDSESRWFAVDYFNDTFDIEDYISDYNSVTFEDGNFTFTPLQDFNYSITLGSDDATENPSSGGTAYFASGSTYLYTGYYSSSYRNMTGAYRFQDIPITKGTIGIEAYLNLYSYLNDGDVDTNITGVLEDNTPTWTTLDRPWSRDATENNTNWNFDAGTSVWKTSPNIGNILDEIVGQDWWDYEDAIGLLVRGNDTNGDYRPRSFEHASGAYAPFLNGTFTVETGNVTSIDITKPDGYWWYTLDVHTNKSDNAGCNFSILDEDGNVLWEGLDGLNSSLHSICDATDVIKLYAEFDQPVTMHSWNVSWILDIRNRTHILGSTHILGNVIIR